jgi:GNAT superfamily N-acetyltransferase
MFKITENYWDSIFGWEYRENTGIHAKNLKNWAHIKDVFLAYDENGKACGMGCVLFVEDKGESKAFLTRFFTLEEYRRKGIAKEIWNEVKKYVGGLGYRQIYMDTPDKATSAIAFWTAMGFSKGGQLDVNEKFAGVNKPYMKEIWNDE